MDHVVAKCGTAVARKNLASPSPLLVKDNKEQDAFGNFQFPTTPKSAVRCTYVRYDSATDNNLDTAIAPRISNNGLKWVSRLRDGTFCLHCYRDVLHSQFAWQLIQYFIHQSWLKEDVELRVRFRRKIEEMKKRIFLLY